MKNDPLGNRMKTFESIGATSSMMMPGLPVVIRLDGKAFHTFTKGLDRPYDKRLTDLMVETTEHLVQYTNAKIGYTQSDEITLILHTDNEKSQVFFNGKRDKINSVLASVCTLFFNQRLRELLPEKAKSCPVFDCRTFTVPSKAEAVNCLIWREADATRNSIQMAGQSNFSHRELHGKSCNQIQEMLFQNRGINWNDYPDFFKRGTYIQRKKIVRKFTTDELAKLPAKHQARTNPDLQIERSDVMAIKMPPLTRVWYIEDVVFDGKEPFELKPEV